VRGHKGQLLQVLLNVTTNAVDSMAEITARTRLLKIQSIVHNGGVSIVIEDSGSGIDPASLEKIFEPFFTTKSHGMGLGLAICRSIVEAHGGRLTASVGNRYGSIFRLDLPIARADLPTVGQNQRLAS
jgi:C4-dicarboxylate-specific signal transduction histidine kinase